MKVFDSVSALDHLKEIKDGRERTIERISKVGSFCTPDSGIENLKSTFRLSKNLWFDTEEEITARKERLLLESLRSEFYARKLYFMINGTGLIMVENELTKADEGIRGYLVLDQSAEVNVSDSTSKVVDLYENSVTSAQFVVYREHEIDLKKEPQLGKVLYKIRADGTLKKMKDNYRF